MSKRSMRVSILAGVLALALVLGLAAGFVPTTVSAASSSELKQQLNALKKEKTDLEDQIQNLKGQISSNSSQIEEMVAQKNIIDQEIFLLYQQIDNINHQIATYSLLIADKQEELVAAEARFSELTEKNRERIQAMEEEGTLSYWSVLFQANSFSDLLDRVNMIREIAAADRRRLEELSAAAKVVSNAKAELETEKAGLEETRASLDATQQELEGKREEADRLLAELVARGMEYELLVEQSEDAQAKLMLEIANKEEEYDDALYREWLATSVPPTTRPKPPSQTKPTTKPTVPPSTTAPTEPKETTEPPKDTKPEEETKPTEETKPSETTKPTEPKETEPDKISWKVPIKYKQFTSPYGWRIHPIYGTKKFHYGVDLAAPKGTPIWATRSGKVTTAAYDSSSGYYVVIDHGDGYKSIYMHMTHYIVKKGQKVSQGEVIGYCGSTGASTGSHLHFGISKNGSYVNPANYIAI